MQLSPFCITKRPLLCCKRGRFAVKCSPFGIPPIAHSRHKSLYSSVYQQHLCCTRKTQEFRAKRRLARSTGSFERSEMQISYMKRCFSCGGKEASGGCHNHLLFYRSVLLHQFIYNMCGAFRRAVLAYLAHHLAISGKHPAAVFAFGKQSGEFAGNVFG